MATRGEITHEQANRAVDHLVTLIEQEFSGFKINEIIKGGSLGHGTAVFGNFDVDLVIYSDGVNTDTIRICGYGPYLTVLDDFLQKKLGGDYVQNEKEKKLVTTGRSIQFTYRNNIAVDLLVSPNWSSLNELYQFFSHLWPHDDCQNYTIFASKWQVQFFKDQPSKVKEYIRRAKAWRNKMWPVEQGSAGKPSSYLISLLVVRAHETVGFDDVGHRVTESLKHIVTGSPDIYWEKNYTFTYAGGGLLTIPSNPRILDPANPINNVWKTGFKTYRPGERISDYEPGDGNAMLLRERIHTIDLSQPDGTKKEV